MTWIEAVPLLLGIVWYAWWLVYRHCALCNRRLHQRGMLCNDCTASKLPPSWRTRL